MLCHTISFVMHATTPLKTSDGQATNAAGGLPTAAECDAASSSDSLWGVSQPSISIQPTRRHPKRQHLGLMPKHLRLLGRTQSDKTRFSGQISCPSPTSSSPSPLTQTHCAATSTHELLSFRPPKLTSARKLTRRAQNVVLHFTKFYTTLFKTRPQI